MYKFRQHGLVVTKHDITALNYIYYHKVGFVEIFSTRELDKQFKNIMNDEVSYYLQIYKLYLAANKRSIALVQKGLTLSRFKPTNVNKIKDLTIYNLKIWIDMFIDDAKKAGKDKKNTFSSIRSFCEILRELKKLYEGSEFDGNTLHFPFKEEEIGYHGKNYRWSNSNNMAFDNSNEHIETLLDYVYYKRKDYEETKRKGTYKSDITHADDVVRAIYNYKIEAEENTVAYFNELQLTTMLRIIADSGVRASEVVNMPFGTVSYLEEEDVNICILGWSKLFERFGVVPIGPETARMVNECSNIRKAYKNTLNVEMAMYDTSKNKSKMDSTYVMQFVNMSKKNYSIKRLNLIMLRKHLKKVCHRAGLQLQEQKSLHLLRHRAAEYFFFCMSYYDFEYKNDHDYKEMIVKRLLRHRDVEMTKEYYWGNLMDLVSKHKLVFLRSLPDVSQYKNEDAVGHIKSIKKKIEIDLNNILTSQNINKIVKLLTIPTDYLNESVLEELAKEKSFRTILDYLNRVDGNKGFVPVGAASFGICTNFSCPKLTEKLTCISCNDHILEEKDVPMMVREIVRCTEAIQGIYSFHLCNIDSVRSNDHLESLRSRVTSLLDRLSDDLEYPVTDVLAMIALNMEIRSKKVGA